MKAKERGQASLFVFAWDEAAQKGRRSLGHRCVATRSRLVAWVDESEPRLHAFLFPVRNAIAYPRAKRDEFKRCTVACWFGLKRLNDVDYAISQTHYSVYSSLLMAATY